MNSQKNLWTVPISELSLLIFNKERKKDEKALNELKRRTKNVEYGVMNYDEFVIDRRGHDINNYLIRKDPSLQQLFETYFTYVANCNPYEGCYSELLFSEKPLCNQMFFGKSFFYTIYNNEIFNLEQRIESNNNKESKEELSIYRRELIKHKETILKRISDSKIGLPKYKHSETYPILSEEILGQKYFNDRFFRDYTTANGSAFYPLEKVYVEILPLAIMTNDSIRLFEHKSILLNQSKRGIKLDYSTEPMQKILKINA